MGCPGALEGKGSASDAGNQGSVLGLGRSPGEGKGNPIQYSCLKNSMDRGHWQATFHGLANSDMIELITHTYFLMEFKAI